VEFCHSGSVIVEETTYFRCRFRDSVMPVESSDWWGQ
jgi:hypothetical protein